MKPRLYIVDDDISIRTILSNIIDDFNLGIIVGESDNGSDAINGIKTTAPDIVFVDLLLPLADGIEIMKNIQQIHTETDFIMISEVNSKEIISDAYIAGVEYFVRKPINVMEVVTVTNNLIEKQNNRCALAQIGLTLKSTKSTTPLNNNGNRTTIKQEIINILSELGIMGEAGCTDIINILELIIKERRASGNIIHKYNMGSLYTTLSTRYETEDSQSSRSAKAIEQRVRRTIQTALSNIATIGIEDFSNYRFERFSSTLFDFTDVKTEMDYIRSKSPYRGKINVKNFLEGLITQVDWNSGRMDDRF